MSATLKDIIFPIKDIHNGSKPITKHELSPLPYLFAYVMPLLVLGGYYFGGIFTYANILLTLIVLPIGELIFPVDKYNPTEEETKQLEQCATFKIITWFWVPAQFITSIGIAIAITQSTTPTSLFELIGLILSAGSCTATGIAVSHELMHKQNKLEQTLAKLILLCACYMHFYIEHLFGHHKRVSTPNDPATSRLNETLYQFVPRCIKDSFLSAWHLECKRLQKKQQAIVSLHNQMIWFALLPLAVIAGLYYFFGVVASVYFIGQALIGVLFLECVNYIEHYGLQRKVTKEAKQDENGKEITSPHYERVTPMHSWNSDHRTTNYLVFKLQRHSDHHAWPTRRYQILRSFGYSPQLPTGYVGMMLLAMVPPLWMRVMNKRVKIYNEIIAATDDKQLIEILSKESDMVILSYNHLRSTVVSALHKIGVFVVFAASYISTFGSKLGGRGPAHLFIRLALHIVQIGEMLMALKQSNSKPAKDSTTNSKAEQRAKYHMLLKRSNSTPSCLHRYRPTNASTATATATKTTTSLYASSSAIATCNNTFSLQQEIEAM